MDSLPEVEDPFPPSGPEPEPESPPEMQPCEVLAEFIRERARAALLTPRKPLAEEEPEPDSLLQAMKETASCQDIVSIQGQKDEY